MNFEKKLIENRNHLLEDSDDMFLYGWLNINDEEYEELLTKSERLLNNMSFFSYDSEEKNLVITLAIIEYSRREYDNQGDLFDMFLLKVKITLSAVNKNKLINRIFEYLNLQAHTIKSNKTNRLRDSILMQSVIIKSNTEKIFDFLVDVYFRELKENINHRNVTMFFRNLYFSFKSFIEKEDNMPPEFNKMTSIIQRLPNFFIYGYYNSPEFVTTILREWLTYIHALNFNRIPVYRKNKYTFLFRDLDKEINLGITVRTKKNKISGEINKNSQGNKYIEILGNVLVINIPSYNVEYERGKKYAVKIYESNKVEIVNHLEIIKTDFGYSTESKKLKINKLSTDIRYEVYEDNKIIYDSKDYFKRDLYLFNENQKLTNLNSLESGKEFTVLTPYYINIVQDNNRQIIVEEGMNIYRSTLEDDTELIINDFLINSEGISYETGFQPVDIYNNVHASTKEGNVMLLKSISNFILRIKLDEYVSDFIIDIDNKKFDLGELYNIEVLGVTGDDVFINIDINKIIRILNLKRTKDFEIYLRKKGSKYYKYHRRVMMIESLDYRFDKKVYTSEKHAELIHLESSLITGEFEKVTHPTNKEGTFTYSISKEIKLIFKLPTVFSKSEDATGIWYEKFEKEEIKTRGLMNNPIWVMEVGGIQNQIKLGKLFSVQGDEKGYQKHNLKNFNSITSLDKKLYLKSNDELILIFNVISVPIVRSVFFWEHNQGDLEVSCEYIGPDNLFITYEDYSGVNKTTSLQLKEGKVKFEGAMNHFHKYKISLTREELTLFKKKVKVLEEHDRYFGDELIIESSMKQMKITHVECCDKWYELKNCYINFKKIKGKATYSGSLYHLVLNHSEKKEDIKYYTHINPVRFTYVESNDDDYIFTGEDVNREAIVFDKERGYLHTYYNIKNFHRYLIVDRFKIQKG